MIFAHLPAGFILWQPLKNRFLKYSKKENFILLLTLLTFSIIPDIDFIFIYFISAKTSHRELISHTIIPYLIIFGIFYLVSKYKKNKFLFDIGLLALLGGALHLILDSINAGIMWLWPIKTTLYGIISSISFLDSLIGLNINAIVLLLEIAITSIAIHIFIKTFIKIKGQNFLYILNLGFFIFIISLFSTNSHLLYKGNAEFLEDKDKDGIINRDDIDMDGDDILNLKDDDANGNGISNKEDLLLIAKDLTNKKYDAWRNRFMGVTGHWGFIINTDLPRIGLAKIGIYLPKELKEDYEIREEKYSKVENNNSPTNPEFYEKPENIKIFFRNQNWILPNNAKEQKGDIIIFESVFDYFGIIVETENQTKILHACPSYENLQKMPSLKSLCGENSTISTLDDIKKALNNAPYLIIRLPENK